ncbi:AAA family ATPase, partial [Halomonas sp. BM-2019]|uniref:AAA family ATPase n=1 Tax=Halomonas sp. BM-2019 TaxID=2811227 RepID=UPI001B3C2E80
MNRPARLSELEAMVAALEGVVLGKSREVRLALCCLLCRGHLLIEDLPGLGKTTLAQSLSRVTGLDMQRLQFTSDLLPADVLGVSVFDPREARFTFHPGPIFHGVVLADEINRATPKTQSALLEAMEEGRVTVEGETRPLPDPFFVIATQNPQEQAGTFALPESQLDRFLMRLSLGYPDRGAEREILRGRAGRARLDGLPVLLGAERLRAWQARLDGIHVSEALLDYVQSLVAASRGPPPEQRPSRGGRGPGAASAGPRAGGGLSDGAAAGSGAAPVAARGDRPGHPAAPAAALPAADPLRAGLGAVGPAAAAVRHQLPEHPRLCAGLLAVRPGGGGPAAHLAQPDRRHA